MNILCLDAPIVAISWQWLFAKSFHLVADPAGVAALFFTTWLIYLADRFVDSASLGPDLPKSARQIFCAQHRNGWLWLLMMPVAAIDIATCWQLGYTTLLRGIFLGVIVIGYLAVNHARSELWQTIPFKELIIGILFAAGTILPLTPHIVTARSTIAMAALLFAALCAVNCISIAIWERELDRVQAKHSIATRLTGAENCLRLLLIVLAPVCIAFAFSHHNVRLLGFCLAGSSTLLAAVPLGAAARDERTALADLVLLAPLALFVAQKIL